MSIWTDMSGWLGTDEINYGNYGAKKMDIRKCLIRLVYYDKTMNSRYSRYHVIDLNIDESIADQIFKKYGSLTPMYIDFKWQEITL